MDNYNYYMNIGYYFYNNIFLNVYLFGYVLFPNIFKDKIINTKTIIDGCHKRIIMVSVRNEILDKYDIDVFDMYNQFQSIINTNIIFPFEKPLKHKKKVNRITHIICDNNNNENENNDNISVMSDLSSLSSLDGNEIETTNENEVENEDSLSVLSLSFDSDDDI